MTTEANIICPECDHENKPKTKRCEKCNFPLAAHGDVERVINAIAKKRKATANPQPQEDEDFLDGLLG